MAYKSGEKSALKKFLNENKMLVYMLPLLVILVAVLIVVYSGNFKKSIAASSAEPQVTPPQISTAPNQSQVEVLPQLIRSSDENAEVVKDPFETPMVLKGIVNSGERSSAIIESGGISYIVRKNQPIGNSSWNVADIETGLVTIASEEKTETLKLPGVDNNDVNVDPKENRITMNIQNADIRDVLSGLGIAMEKNIIFTGEPSAINYSISNAEKSDALNFLLKTLGMAFIENESTIIVGTRESLNNDFFNNIALTRFSLKYLSSDIIAAQIDSLGIPVKKVTLDTNKNAIWVQGLPQELGKVRELITMLDKSDNVSGQASTLMLTPLTLTYITAEQMNGVLSNMGIPGGMILDSNPMTLWIYGDNSVIAQISEIKKKVDIAENAKSESILLTERKLNYLTHKEITDILTKLNVNVNIITLDRKLQTIWLTGDSETVKLATSIIGIFDLIENSNYNLFFVYKFKNITAEEGERRFKLIGIEEAVTYTFSFPEFSKSLMVFCAADYKQTVLNNLAQLDIETEKIKVPIDFSDHSSGASKLKARRDLIVNLTGIPADSFTITGNVSRDEIPHYIMYLEETAEEIERVKDLIKSIDDPLTDGANP